MSFLQKNFISFLLFLLSSVFLSLPALSQTDKHKTAEEHNQKGISFAKQGLWDAARKEFEEAYKLDPNPDLLFNIGRCYEKNGELNNALSTYKIYLKASISNDQRLKVEGFNAEIEEKLRKQPGILKISSDVDGVEVKIDGNVIGRTPLKEMELSPGRHVIIAVREGFEPWKGDVFVEPSAKASIVIPMVPSSLLVSAASSKPVSRIWAWTALGAGAAICGTGIIFTLLADSDRSKVENAKTDDKGVITGISMKEAKSLESGANTKANTAAVLYGIGGAAMASSVVLFIMSMGDEETQEKSASSFTTVFSAYSDNFSFGVIGRF
jgi:hypothetical protein